MLNILKFDLYKLFKSKEMKIFLIFTLLLCLFNPIAFVVINPSSSSALRLMLTDSTNNILVIIFVTLFICKDFTSGYFKNITNVSKFKYILSKLTVILMYILFVFVVLFLYFTFFQLTFGNKIIYDPLIDKFAAGSLVGSIFLNIGLDFALGCIIMFLCFLIKKEYIVLIISILYLIFVSAFLYSSINQLLGNGLNIRNYTVLGNLSYLQNNLGNIKFTLISLANIAWYSIVFFLLSWLTFRKRSV